MAYDSARGVVVLYGGDTRDTWEYDGLNWVQRASTGPNPDRTLRMVYDSALQRVRVVTSRERESTEVWEWDGVAWEQVMTANAPFGRTRFAISYDIARQRIVLFGGETSKFRFSDTWELIGLDWVQRSSGGPPGRSWHRMAYHSVRGVTLLYGGIGGPAGISDLTDTWEWNGTYWLERFGIHNPGPRPSAAMAYDATRARIVVYGTSASDETWEWDGVSWILKPTLGTPPELRLSAMAHDSARGKMVLFGGGASVGSWKSDQTWEYSILLPNPAQFTKLGVGCSSRAGIPVLETPPGELPYIGETFTLNLAPIPSSILNIPFGMLGLSGTMWGSDPLPKDLSEFGMPGCSAFIAPLYTVILTNDGGSAVWDIDIPAEARLIGFEFVAQCLVLDPGVNPLGAVVSNGGAGVVGAR